MKKLGLVLLLSVGASSPAAADVLGVWVNAKVSATGTNSDLSANFNGPFGAGIEAGAEVMGLEAYAEAMLLGNGQALFSANFGMDITFFDDMPLTLGAFTGPILWHTSVEGAASSLDYDNLGSDDRLSLENAAGDLGMLNDRYSAFAESAGDISRYAFGWNLRARATLEYPLLPMVSVGALGQVGYHLVIAGDQALAGAKSAVVDEFAEEAGLPDQATSLVRKAVGVDEVSPDRLSGFNFELGLFARLAF